MIKPYSSLSKELFLKLLFLLATIFISVSLLTYLTVKAYTLKVYDDWLADSAYAISNKIIKNKDGISYLSPDEFNLVSWDVKDETYIQISSIRDGYIYGLKKWQSVPFEKTKSIIFFDDEIDGKKVRVARKSFLLDSVPFTVYFAETLIKRDLMQKAIFPAIVYPFLILFVVSFGIIWLILARTFNGLKKLTDEIGLSTHASLTVFEKNNFHEEVRPLVNVINDLIGRLKFLIRSQKQFIYDAAHQLRTPLTALKLHIDSAKDSLNLNDLKSELIQIETASNRTVRLSNQLLLLAKSEYEQANHSRRLIDITALLQEVIGTFKSQADSLEITFEGVHELSTDKFLIEGNWDLLFEAVSNVIDNALKYSLKKQAIHLDVVHNLDTVTLKIVDFGGGVPKEDLQRLGEPFFQSRKPSAIANITNRGSGLGLAIVKDIVFSHGGSVLFFNGEFGLVVEISLPSAEALNTKVV